MRLHILLPLIWPPFQHLYFPELSESVSKNEIFVEIVLAKDKKDLLIELKVDETMGKDLEKKDIKKILDLAKQCEELFKYREQSLLYVDDLMEKYCPNLKAIAGTSIGAKLIEHTGSLRKIAMLPASTIQILGAEKALFRHLKTGARPPKFGIIFDHQFIQKSQRKDQGKRARSLADKLCIAAKIDFFKGEFIGDKLRKELESKFQ